MPQKEADEMANNADPDQTASPERSGPQDYKTSFRLNLAEHEIKLFINVKIARINR